jgi:hypothetical protein
VDIGSPTPEPGTFTMIGGALLLAAVFGKKFVTAR